MFEWDEAKNQSNIAKHGISFERAQRIFEGPVLSEVDDSLDYGEERVVSLGMVDGIVCLVVVHTDRDDHIRLISARRANRMERNRYEQSL